MGGMEAILEEKDFCNFGEDLLNPYARTSLRSTSSEDSDSLRAQVRKYVPREPGVYGMLDPKDRLIYVGKSKCLRNRLLSYFLPNNEEDKAGRIVQSTKSIIWEPQPSDFAALLREQFLIRHFQPRFNVQGIPRRQQAIFICLGRQPAEQFYTSKKSDANADFVLGPLTGAGRANRAVEVLNRIYQLRDCNSTQPCSFTEQMQLFDIELRPGCIRLEIKSCLGPCISACSRKEYDAQVDAARKFLRGQSDYPVERVETMMAEAATNLHFEQASVLREDLRCVRWLMYRTQDIATARQNYTFVYPVESYPETGRSQCIWYLIRHGMIEGAIAKPRNSDDKTQTRELLTRWYKSDNSIGSGFVARPESLALVTSWFKKNGRELKKTFKPTPKRLDRMLSAQETANF
ncbi:MAG: GIY-YIG nuclease family protein [Planctomycetota bacterium]